MLLPANTPLPWKTEARSCDVWHHEGDKHVRLAAIEFRVVLEGIWQLASPDMRSEAGHALFARTFTLPGAAWSPEVPLPGIKIVDKGTSEGE